MPDYLLKQLRHFKFFLLVIGLGVIIFFLNRAPQPAPLPLPITTPYRAESLYAIKGIWTDFWQNRDEIANNGVGSIAVNAVWIEWDFGTKLPPCAAGEEEYLGECFKIHRALDEEIKFYSGKNIEVYAVVYGTPERFRIPNCKPATPGRAIFCAPKKENLDAFGRFAGMLARRYDGAHGNGKISGFIIGNEVNRNEWYNNGCGAGVLCAHSPWIASYADFFKAGYDGIMINQPSAKLFISFDHAFDKKYWDGPTSISLQTFLPEFARLMEKRVWRVAYHPYNTNLFAPSFNATDTSTTGIITMGSIGILPGWLKKTFPDKPEVYQDIKLTESGFHSGETAAGKNTQAQALCHSFRNVLGTPGITTYIYNRMVDNAQEGGLLLGLRTLSGEAKPAWATWALMNRPGINLDCGFELLPFTKLTRGYHPAQGHWISSRLLPPGFTEELSWKLLRENSHTESTTLLYECGIGTHTFLSADYACEGQEPRGPVGYAWVNPQQGLDPLYRCYIPSSGDHFISSDPLCEDQRVEQLLGYAHPFVPITTPTTPVAVQPAPPPQPPVSPQSPAPTQNLTSTPTMTPTIPIPAPTQTPIPQPTIPPLTPTTPPSPVISPPPPLAPLPLLPILQEKRPSFFQVIINFFRSWF